MSKRSFHFRQTARLNGGDLEGTKSRLEGLQRVVSGSSARILTKRQTVSSRQRPAAGSGARDGNRRHGNRGAGQEPVPVGAGVRPVSGQPQLPELSGSERGPEGETLHQLPQVSAVLEGARICQVPQVSSLPAHAGAAAVRTLQEGAGQCSVCQVHRRAAAAALAALLQEEEPPAAGAGRAAAAAAAATRGRRRQVMMSSPEGGGPATCGTEQKA